MAEFIALEQQDGVRMPWNVIPGTKQESINCVIPVSVFYTPLKPLISNPNSPPLLPYAPLRCRSCRSILNPFSVVDFAAKIWVCAFCFNRNHFPTHYASISDDNLPAELFPQYTTIEYESPVDNSNPRSPNNPNLSVCLFVVDTCMIEEEIGFLKMAVLQAVELLPEGSLVGLITFGSLVSVQELGFSGGVPKSFVFKGGKEISKEMVVEQLGFFERRSKPVNGVVGGVRDGLSAESIARFLLPASECEFALNSVMTVSLDNVRISVFVDVELECWCTFTFRDELHSF